MAVLYYTDHYEFPLPPEHKFPLRKYRHTRELLVRDGYYEFQPASLAESLTVELAHDTEYTRQFLTGTLPPPAMRRIGFPCYGEPVEATANAHANTYRMAAEVFRC